MATQSDRNEIGMVFVPLYVETFINHKTSQFMLGVKSSNTPLKGEFAVQFSEQLQRAIDLCKAKDADVKC